MQQQQHESLEQKNRQNFDLLYLVASSHTTVLWTFLHRNMGVDFYGFWNMSVGVLMLVLLAAGADAPEMAVFLFIWLFMVMAQRQCTYNAVSKGALIHSKSWGEPVFVQKLLRNYWLALVIGEPALCLGVAYLIADVSSALAMFIAAGAVSIPFIVFVDWLKERRIDIAMDDAQIEMETRARRYQERRGMY
jgi:hypothetical protein